MMHNCMIFSLRLSYYHLYERWLIKRLLRSPFLMCTRHEIISHVQGTAISAEEEFFEVYNLYVFQIPTHKPSIRIDHPARVYLR